MEILKHEDDKTFDINIFQSGSYNTNFQEKWEFIRLFKDVFVTLKGIQDCLADNFSFVSICEEHYNLIILSLFPELPSENFRTNIAEILFTVSELLQSVTIPGYPLKELKSFDYFEEKIQKTYETLEKQINSILQTDLTPKNNQTTSSAPSIFQLNLINKLKEVYEKEPLKYKDQFLNLKKDFERVTVLFCDLKKLKYSEIKNKCKEIMDNKKGRSNDEKFVFEKYGTFVPLIFNSLDLKFNELRFNENYSSIFYDYLYRYSLFDNNQIQNIVCFNFLIEANRMFPEDPTFIYYFNKVYQEIFNNKIFDENSCLSFTKDREFLERLSIELNKTNDNKDVSCLIELNLEFLKIYVGEDIFTTPLDMFEATKNLQLYSLRTFI